MEFQNSGWINFFKKENIQLKSDYKRLTSILRKPTDTKGREGKITPCKWKPKESKGVIIYMPDKIEFKPKTVKKIIESHYITMGSIHQEDITVVKFICAQLHSP